VSPFTSLGGDPEIDATILAETLYKAADIVKPHPLGTLLGRWKYLNN